jgi:hypothetical protein
MRLLRSLFFWSVKLQYRSWLPRQDQRASCYGCGYVAFCLLPVWAKYLDFFKQKVTIAVASSLVVGSSICIAIATLHLNRWSFVYFINFNLRLQLNSLRMTVEFYDSIPFLWCLGTYWPSQPHPKYCFPRRWALPPKFGKKSILFSQQGWQHLIESVSINISFRWMDLTLR